MYAPKNHSTHFKSFTLNNIDCPSTLQSCCSSLTRGSMKISKSFGGELDPGVNKAIMKFDSSMHTHGGMLYGNKY
jgi:hypothetical protein